MPIRPDHRLQLTLDIINLFNLIDSSKGLNYYVSNQNDIPWTLQGSNFGVDPDTGQMRIRWSERPNRFALSQLGSRWQIQFGVRYSFD